MSKGLLCCSQAEPLWVPLEFCRYHHTAPINSFFSLRESLAMLAERVSGSRLAGEYQQCPWGLEGPWVPGDPGSSRDLLSALCPQGLENSWERHRANCTRLCQGLLAMGLELFVEEEVGAGQAHHHHRVGGT